MQGLILSSRLPGENQLAQIEQKTNKSLLI